MKQEFSKVIAHDLVQDDYYCLELAVREISSLVKPGQFLEILVPNLGDGVLRRPFSIYNVDIDSVSILYKVVGKGTRAMRRLSLGETVDIIGPLGNGFPGLTNGNFPVLIAGGYGAAALYLQAKKIDKKGAVFIGGRSGLDILCVEDFKELGWDVLISTEDGSLGESGLITDLFDQWLVQYRRTYGIQSPIEIFACGPEGLLRTVGDRAKKNLCSAWLSMDRHMACGMGVCLTCVIKQKTPENGWQWARCCKDGPVFESREVLWDE